MPVRTLHDFLFEISREWDKFRTGSLLSIIISIALLVLLMPILRASLRSPGPFDTLLWLGVVVALIYNAYLAYVQHAFYRRWEKRMGLLMALEEQILGEEKPS